MLAVNSIPGDKAIYWGDDYHAIEAWERMTDGGCSVVILPKRQEPIDPWGIDRFREPTPPGGLRLVSWGDHVTR